MDINTRYKHGELSADVAKAKKEKLAIDPNDASAITIIENVAKAAGFKKKRQKWLSNYLKEYKTTNNGPDVDADTGW